MIDWLKKHFIPHEGNGHRPHLLRGENARWIVITVLLVECLTFLVPTIIIMNVNSQMGAVIEAILDQGTNQNRAAQDLPQLTVNPVLNESAQLKADDMAANGYFAHVSPTGKTPWYWFKQVGYKYSYAGENLAINFTDSTDVTNAWMNSPTHRANILDAHYTEMGTGIATGTYEGKETIFIAQEFATPASADASAAGSASDASPAAAPVPVTSVPASVSSTTTALTSSTSSAPQVAVVTAPSPASQTTSSTSSASSSVTAVAAAVATDTPEVLGAVAATPPAANEPVIAPSFFQKALASPRHTTDIVLEAILAIVMVALGIILFKVNVRHPDLITNGLLVVALIFGIYILNGFISHHGASVADNAGEAQTMFQSSDGLSS